MSRGPVFQQSMTTRCTRPLVAALLFLAGPARAQPADAPAVEADAQDASDAPSPGDPVPVPDPTDDLADGEVIEIAGPPPLVSARVSGEAMSREEVSAMPGGRGDAFETVRSLPGVAFAPAFDGAGDLAIRGTRGADSLYLVDGIPVPQTMHFGNVTAIMPAEMIESIELLPGGFDVEYGRATGGVVEIRTRRPRVDRWGGAAEVSFIHASAYAQGPLWKDEVAVAASFRRSFLDIFLPAVIGDDSDLSFSTPPTYTDAQVRLDWTPGYRHEVSLVGLYSDDRIGIELDAENAQDPVLTGDIGTSDSFWRAIASWRYEGSRVGSRAAVSYGASVEKIQLNQSHFLDSRPDELMAREDLRIDVADWLRLRGGADLRVLPWDVSVRMPTPPGEGRPDPIFTTAPTIDA